MQKFNFKKTIPFILLLPVFFFIASSVYRPNFSNAQTSTSTLQSQIDTSNAQITKLQQEIAQLQSQLTTTASQRRTLQNAIGALQLNIQKLQKSIALTQTEINLKNQQINQLSSTISLTSGQINTEQNDIGDSLHQLYMLDQEPLIVNLLGGGTLSSFFDQSATLEALRSGLVDQISKLSALRTNLQDNKTVTEEKKQQLSSLQQNLSQQQKGVAITLQTKNQLLVQTKNKESNYQTLIAQKRAQESQFESDLQNYESQLHLNVGAGSIPPAGPVLAWPVASVYITQYFGNTPFATQNPQIYRSHGHTGIDLAASPGTPIMAARGGFVVGTGNTDLDCPYASFGKWIFIQHDDGLSTIYAHLSVIGVTKGQQVTTGQVIGYSDTTGYATGPHLHFGVYATSGTKISSFPSAGCKGKIFTVPVGAISAYLNPLSYLPKK